tara:strand:- start:18 stop:1190 length:1173 start_codon:yes stop_codon:yes gene_type:complete
MPQNLNRHQHKAAAAEARQFPANEEQLAEYLRTVHELRQTQITPPKRCSTRFDVEGLRVVMTVMHPGGSLTASESVLLDLSEGGAGVLYPGFVHQDSTCVVHIDTLQKERLQIAAQSVWCRFIGRTIHAVGVRWLEKVDVRKFVSSRDWLEQMAESDDFSSSDLSGRLLAVGIDDLELTLLQSYLSDTTIRIDTAKDSGAAIDRLAAEGFDFVMVDSDNPEAGAHTLHAHIRSAGTQEPMLFVTSKPDGVLGLESAAGVSILSRPYSADMVIGALRDLSLDDVNPLSGSKPIFCELPDAKHGPVTTYLERLRDSSGTLEQAIIADKAGEAVRVAQLIKNTASGFGFPLLEQAAESAIVAVNASGSAAEAEVALRTLCRVISRLRLRDDAA